MKALQIMKPYEFKIVEVPNPTPKDDEVVVKLEYAAICNQNDYKIFYGEYGDLIKYPMDPGAFGHEGVGLVDQVGKKVKSLKKGDRVIMTGDGGPMLYSEFVLRKADSVVSVDKKIPVKETAILELFGCGYHCLEHLDVKNKEIGLAGLGPAGLAILQLLMLRKPKKVIGIEISKERAAEAARFGLKEVVSPLDEPAFKQLKKTGVDIVIDCTGVPQSMLNSFDVTRREVMIFGFTNKKFEVDQSKWFQKELIIRNTKVQTIDDLKAVVKLLEAGKISGKEFISGVDTFENYAQVVEKIYKKEAIKILMEWR
ncbi:MAG: hypothetical protein A2231_09760 [Candidatus Firestonebacteria bacterium RIFOXYA2_FULL_40_8]|nr:MAG: hypothetical protein A2231_09760 [Candidatus Firestonebacteria bacterium RIFOXYA2_FULL_40_8]